MLYIYIYIYRLFTDSIGRKGRNEEQKIPQNLCFFLGWLYCTATIPTTESSS
jgi:hypothetical protein